MILRADYLNNQHARLIANRQILKQILKEKPIDSELIKQRLKENYNALKTLKLSLKKLEK